MSIYFYIVFLFLVLFLLVLIRFLGKKKDPFGDLQIPNQLLNSNFSREGKCENQSMD